MEKPTPTCKNGQKMIWGATTFEYEENDILVEVSNVPAWICPDCDDVSFPPGVSQQLITSVRELITATRRSRAINIPLNESDPELRQMIAESRAAYKAGEGSDFANLLTAGKTGQEQTMTPLMLDPKYVDVFQVFGNLDEIVEKAIHDYAIKRINERIEKSRQEVLSFEAKYGMTYQEFLERVTTDETFVDNLENNYLTWEMDWQTWEYYTEVLDEWLGRLKKLSTI